MQKWPPLAFAIPTFGVHRFTFSINVLIDGKVKYASVVDNSCSFACVVIQSVLIIITYKRALLSCQVMKYFYRLISSVHQVHL